VSIRSLRARLERLQARAGARYVIGQDRDRDRKRRQELSRLKLNPGLTDAQTAEMAKLDAFYEIEDRDHRRERELFYKQLNSRLGGPALTDEERKEHAELRDRYPPDPENSRFRERYKELAAQLRAIADSPTGDGGRNNSKPNDSEPPAVVQGCMTSEGDRGPAPIRPAPSAAEKLKSAPPDLITDAELREQLLLAANRNVVPGEGIEDVGPVRVMLESGIKLDDVLCTLSCEVDRRAYPKNKALASWSEHRFVMAVAEQYGLRVMLPVIKEKLKARGKPTYARASAKTACDDDGRTE
jgi:hypothetical protein